MKKLILIFLLLLPLAWCVEAWGATYTITWDGDDKTIVDGDTFCSGECQPGDIIEFASGTDVLYLQDIIGTVANPIIIRNTSTGQAIINLSGNSEAIPNNIFIDGCEYITLDGTNASGVTYGIRLTNGNQGIKSGTWVGDCPGLVIHNVQIDNTGGQGIAVRVDDDRTSSPIVGPIIYNCYLDTIGREGMYIGGYTEHQIWHQDVAIYDNILVDIGWDGIQLRKATLGTNIIHDNTVTNWATAQVQGHAAAIALDNDFVGSVYNNDLTITVSAGSEIGGWGFNIRVFAPQSLTAEIYNNVIDMGGQGTDGFFIGDSNATVTAYQNTILNAPDDGFYVRRGATLIARDNIICGIGGSYIENDGANVTDTNNLKNACAANNFIDLDEDDFSLTNTSPAVDTGSASGYPNADIVGTVRPQGEKVDRGAYEYIFSDDPPPPSDWSRKCELVIQNGQVPGDLSNFPVLITAATLPEEMIDSDHADYAANKAQVDGGDLLFFTDEALTQRIACEIIDFTHGATPTAEIWVKVPSVSGSVDTSVWVAYNATGKSQPAANEAFGSEAVWDSNSKGVWHFEEADAGGGTVYYDATSNSNDGTLTDADDDSTRSTGQIGAAIGFNGDADYINAGNDSSLEMGIADWTISCWTKMAAGDNWILEKGAINPTTEGYGLFYYGTNDDIRGYVCDGATRVAGDSNDTLALDDSTWRFIAVTFDRDGDVTFYSDSGGTFAADGTNDISGFDAVDITNNSENLDIGRWSTYYSVTEMDELRVVNTLRSSNWLTASYNNQKTPNTFIVEGAPENIAATDTTRPTILAVGWWDVATDTCVLDKSITYTSVDDVIPLCLKCDEELSIEIPGQVAGPTIAMALDYPVAGGTATYAGYYNDGTNGYIKVNYPVGDAGERATDLSAVAVDSLSLGLSSVENAFSITNADPAVVSSTAHGLSVGGFVFFKALGEMTEVVNQVHEITAISDNTFTLGELDASGYAAEIDDGDEEYQSTSVYIVDPTGNMLDPDLTAAGVDFSTSAIIVAVPKTANDPWTFPGDYDTHADWVTAGGHEVPLDFFEIGKGGGVGDITIQASGASGNIVTFTILGNANMRTDFDVNSKEYIHINGYNLIRGSILNKGTGYTQTYIRPTFRGFLRGFF